MKKYYIWSNITDQEDPTTEPGIEVPIRWWYPAWLVGLVVRYKIWRYEKNEDI